ncbi:hypothetical protein GO013_02475 [Pseudodesulfovibrio sp. JC047]|uniref:phage tail protein n=1 Tax=Pseudodesulfovibrio sp. JC047 TaxID=2683199 RepID=UPI0013D0F9BD|nr:phage tail protein [Pseudodesulfovibrio sp. JC047]NDV18281.1 hypothetical protein [Pseudodesulfovibrio sp. JC047]
MSIFKEYFFKTLRWPLIHRAGPLAVIVEGLARSMDEVRRDIIWLRNQFNPWTCDETMIAAHAESRGIIRHPSESETKYKDRCIRAFAWHRLGGGQMGMPRILDHFGYPDTKMLNVRTEDPDRWAEFKARIPALEGMNSEDYQRIGWIAGETKPARSKLAGIQATSNVPVTISAGGTTISIVRIRLLPERVTAIHIITNVHGGGYTHTVARTHA